MRSDNQITIRDGSFIGKGDKALLFATILVYCFHTVLHFLPISDHGACNAEGIISQSRDTWLSLCGAPLFCLLFMPALLCIVGSFVWLMVQRRKHGVLTAKNLCKALGAALLGMIWQFVAGGFVAIQAFPPGLEDGWATPTVWCHLFFLTGALAVLLSAFVRRRLKKINM